MEQKNSQRQELLRMLAGKTGRDPAVLERELARGELKGVLGGMDPAARAEAERVLGDPKRIRQMLEQPQVKELLRKLNGG